MTSSLKSVVELKNTESHDSCAAGHDFNVPYINRPRTRAYYWSLIATAVREEGGKFSGARVLELGCGTGTFTDLALTQGAISYAGVDLSPNMIQIARQKISDSRVSYAVQSLSEAARTRAGQFDIILSSSFLHHLVDLREGIGEIQALLAPGGIYVGLHEPIVPHQHGFIEKIDGILQLLAGYSHGDKNIFKRLVFACAGYWRFDIWGNPAPFFDVYSTYIRLKDRLTGTTLAKNLHIAFDEQGQNLVDYQLNQPFSLAERIGDMGNVNLYPYLCFPEMQRLMRRDNYQMFSLRKP
jgi:SAM-dependent methyltransferase